MGGASPQQNLSFGDSSGQNFRTAGRDHRKVAKFVRFSCRASFGEEKTEVGQRIQAPATAISACQANSRSQRLAFSAAPAK
jgi:hypothetical protein